MNAKQKIEASNISDPETAQAVAHVFYMDVTTARKALNQLVDEGKMVMSLDGRTKFYTAVKAVAKKTRKRAKSIGSALGELFTSLGANNVTLEQALEVAKSIKENTKFNARHLA